MRIVADLPSADILQVEKTPDLNVAFPFNGRFSVPVPAGAALEVTHDSIVGGGGPNDVWAQGMSALLAQYPMYEYIVYNPLLTAADMDDIDLTALGPSSLIPRLQMGRGATTDPGPTGNAPNMVALLPRNTRVVPSRPGCLVTSQIDIGPMTSGVGADEFMVWWKTYNFTTTEDVSTDYGLLAGTNEPSFKNIVEVDQEPSTLAVYITHDDGATWTPIDRLDPTDLIFYDTRVRLAFINTSASVRVYLAGYAILF